MIAGSDGYRIESHPFEQRLLCPAGQVIAKVTWKRSHEFRIDSLVFEDYSDVVYGDHLSWRKVLEEIAERHYRLTSSRHQRIRDRLNKWVDYPIVKLIGIVAAVVAAAASVRGCMN